MGDVVELREAAEAKVLSRALGVSVGFLSLCRKAGLPPAQVFFVLEWFLSLDLADRLVVIKSVLRSVRARSR